MGILKIYEAVGAVQASVKAHSWIVLLYKLAIGLHNRALLELNGRALESNHEYACDAVMRALKFSYTCRGYSIAQIGTFA